jgi:hypothetical protein
MEYFNKLRKDRKLPKKEITARSGLFKKNG